MAIYKVEAPDGSIIELEGPANATDAQIGQAAQAAFAQRAEIAAEGRDNRDFFRQKLAQSQTVIAETPGMLRSGTAVDARFPEATPAAPAQQPQQPGVLQEIG